MINTFMYKINLFGEAYYNLNVNRKSEKKLNQTYN